MEKIQQLTELTKVGQFFYSRFQSYSSSLNREVPYGLLSTSSAFEEGSEFLYFFHGGNGDDRQFVQAGLPEIVDQSLFEMMKFRKLKIVLPYIGASFLQGPFAPYFFDELIPFFDGKGTPKRYIAGLSLGGQVALSAFLKRPGLFGSVGAHFPALVDFDFLSAAEVNKFAARVGIDPSHLDVLLSEFKRAFSTPGSYQASDPLFLGENLAADTLQSKNIYFDVGSRDDFGLYEGAEKLSALLRKKSIRHTYLKVEGGRHEGLFLHSRLNFLLSAMLK